MKNLGVALLVVVLLGGVGTVNYRRNLEAEETENGGRRLSGYDTFGLKALAQAYRKELEDYELRHAGVRNRSVGPSDKGLIGDNVREFERVQRTGERIRSLNTEIGQRQARLDEVEQELAYRDRVENGGWRLHLQRLTGL